MNTNGLELSDSQLASRATLHRSSVLNLNGSGIVGARAAALGTIGSYTPRGTGSALNSKLGSSLSLLAELDRDSGRVLREGEGGEGGGAKVGG